MSRLIRLFPEASAPASALEDWRDAAALVRDRWDQVLAADRRSRQGAHAAYRAALDLEEAAAAVLATESLPLAA
jgi:hypothetical protein